LVYSYSVGPSCGDWSSAGGEYWLILADHYLIPCTRIYWLLPISQQHSCYIFYLLSQRFSVSDVSSYDWTKAFWLPEVTKIYFLRPLTSGFSLPFNRWQWYIPRIRWSEREAACLPHFSRMFSRPTAAAQRRFCYFNKCLCWLGSETHRAAYPIEYRGFPGVKRPQRESDYSVPSAAEVENEWSLFILTQYPFIASTGSNLQFLLQLNFGNWIKSL
jgi:hypothetical protein